MQSTAAGGVGNGSTIMAEEIIKIENPFVFKVGQVFTGFGIGCGLGIGVGRPLNLGAIPVLDQFMVATRGASDAFSGVGRHVNTSLRKFRAKNVEAGIGCGIGFGHGVGVGLAIKPRVVHQIQSCVLQAIMNTMTKFGIVPNLSNTQGILPASLQSRMTMTNELNKQNPIGGTMQMQLATKEANSISEVGMLNKVSTYESSASKSAPRSLSHGSHTEKVVNRFLQNQFLKDEDREPDNTVCDHRICFFVSLSLALPPPPPVQNHVVAVLCLGKVSTSHFSGSAFGEVLESSFQKRLLQPFWTGHLQFENNMLHMVLKHQQIIEELMEENEKLCRVLVEDLKIPPGRLKASYSGRNTSPCTDCFDCRRKQRKRSSG